MKPVRFTVPGPPIPKGRPRVFRRNTITPKETVQYERKVALCARTAGAKRIDGDVSLSVAFYMPTARRADLDNLCKAVMDSLNGIAWNDDSQVSMLFASRLVDRADPRAVVSVEPVGVKQQPAKDMDWHLEPDEMEP